eukprot:TRINITY_DN6180_c0_g1_i4.p1 TRINITY_DN6180_c0_g1~~TRINITY_DN6180_c0_g1_i4.p1  ORF type:complete len:240 (-),score=64.51 TRINITY_DN6180_c0_g1_i4:64-783(-)
MPNLQVLEFWNSVTDGTISSCLSSLEHLEVLNLGGSYSGTIPSLSASRNSLRRLNFAYVGSSGFGGSLSGTIPSSIFESPLLESLVITSQKVSGTIPSSISKLSKMKELRLSSNLLSGPFPIPKESNLEKLIVNSNSFEGDINEIIHSNFTSLQELVLSNPNIYGTLSDTTFAHLNQWRYIYIFNTSIEGTLPTTLCLSNRTVNLDIGKSKLSGTIPSCIFLDLKLTYLTLQFNARTLR